MARQVLFLAAGIVLILTGDAAGQHGRRILNSSELAVPQAAPPVLAVPQAAPPVCDDPLEMECPSEWEGPELVMGPFPRAAFRSQFFGDFLWLRPGNDKVAYAVPINGAIIPPAGAAPVQIAREAVADIGFDPGFRVGFSTGINQCSTLGATYTHFESEEAGGLEVTAPSVIRSLVDHPGTTATPTDFLAGTASSGIDFQLADLDYRRTFLCDEFFCLNYLLGLRYGHLRQGFGSRLTNSTTVETVDTDIRFDGGGARIGLEGKRRAWNSGLMLYGRGVASLIGGTFRSQYLQADNFRGEVVNAGWKEDRIVPIVDFEAGLAWTGPRGHLRFSAGYLFSAWFNVISTDEFVQAVRVNNSVATGDAVTFDGVAVRAEVRF